MRLLLLLCVGGFGAVLAGYDATVSWSNATVSTEPELRVALTTGNDPLLPVDAAIQIHLNQFFTVAADASVDTTALQQTTGGTWSVSVAANAFTVQRNGDGTPLNDGTELLFQLTGVTNPIRAGLITVGDVELSSSTDSSLTRILPLQTMQIEPGRLRNSLVTFANLLSGRSTSLTIQLTLAHDVPNDGIVVIYLPYVYGSLSTVALSSLAGMDGTFTLSTKNNMIRIQRVAGSGTGTAGTQQVVIELSGIIHPLLEGPMGLSVLLQTLDGSSRIIDQAYVDTSLNYLSKAQVQISTASLQVAEGDINGAQYAVVLNASPNDGTAITLSIGDAVSRATLVIQPHLIVFTAGNWSTAVQINVAVRVDDHVASGTAFRENVIRISHNIVDGDSEGAFAAVNEVDVHIGENDFPAVHISNRFLAVVQGLRNDSYEISLLSQPVSDVIIHLASRDSFIVTLPEEVVFTASSWGTPQSINVIAFSSASDVSLISGISHQVISNDINYGGKDGEVFPQNEILVYFEPLTMVSCATPCRAGWFPLPNATTGDSQCVSCPLGHFCPGSCSAPAPCPKGTASATTFAGNANTCQACSIGTYAHTEGLPTCLVCPAGSYCNDAKSIYQPCPAGSFSSTSETQCHECPAGMYNGQASQSACTHCPRGYYCPKGAISPIPCTAGMHSVNSGATPCSECPAGYACYDPTVGPVACVMGTYSLANSTLCTGCPSGYFCSKTDQPPQLCGAGFYSAQNSTSCSACPRGYMCSSTSTSQPVACSDGTYSSIEGAASCRVCPAGHSCVDATQPPVLCKLGDYSLEGDSICSVCPAGSYCPDQYNSPQHCASGSYSLGGAILCTLCGSGVSCSANAAPVACAPGYYSINASTSCKLCEAGNYCSSAALPPASCLQGTYSLGGAVECTMCPFGYMCSPSGETTACGLGQMNNADHSGCVSCPKGYDCSPLNSAPMPCAVGSYSLDGDGRCTVCPKGYKCALTTTPPSRCADGMYSTGGSTDCLECPAGFYCSQPAADPLPCPVWYYSGKSSTACTPCSPGMDCSSSSVLPVACPSGTYSLVAASACLSCPAGSMCPNSTSAPIACTPGNFSVQGQTTCTPCSAGYYCPQSGQSAQLSCAKGSYAEGGATACTTCPAGMQCPSQTHAIREACLPGTYSLGGQKQCTSCPIGSMCPRTDGSQNAVCAPGWFSSGGAVDCTICPAGYACPDPTHVLPVICPSGHYSLIGSTLCTPCPAGYACPDSTTKLLVPCAKGTYSTGGASSCIPCPAGYQCAFSNSSIVDLCPTGYYSTSGSAVCVECPQGYYCDKPNEMPKNCSVGYYSSRASTSCVACEPGYECPRSDQPPQPCPVGYYSEGAVANCRSCYPGYKCSLASTNPTPPSDACPMGGYCNPPTTFFLCPAGTFGNVTAGESIDQACEPCTEGYYCEMGTTPLTRQVCPAGLFCPEGTKRGSQNPCPAGTYNPNAGQKNSGACQLCPAGSYCFAGTSQPQPCPQGYYCLEGTVTANQYPCPAGTFSGQSTGLIIASQCHDCTLGSYCPIASSTPTKCPAGTYNPQTGSAGLHECLDCPPGWSCPRVGQIDYVDRCAQGHYCPGGTAVATDHPCPAGTYTNEVDLIRSQDCTICPLRHACLQGTGGATQTMLNCGAGFFCPNGTAYSNQFPCPPGTWSSSTSLSTAAECDVCPRGKYCQGGKSFIDGSCAQGHYCPFGTSSSTQFPCPSGTYTANTWLFDPSQCDDCPPGYYCPAGSVAPIPCKPGSYTSVNNTKTVGPAESWPSCITCPAGYFCVEASTIPTPCGKGSFSASGAKACSPCEAGYFCNSNATSATNMRSKAVGWSAPGALYGACYNGTYCPPGSDSEPALETDACPPGYFCPTATPAPVICPAGTYSNLTGQDSMSDCTPTPAGFFSLEGALAPTGVCSPGFYCPLRSTSRTQVPCPARYYLNRTMGQSEDDCALCVSGSYCPIGTAYPVACPPGYYCRTGISTPEPCPIGTYANASGLRQVGDCLLCPPGMYCDTTALTVPRGPCDPGYYCTLGAYTSAPMNYESTLFGVSNRHTGGQCPQGAYCPLGSTTPTLCPPGTYNNFTGLESEAQCVPCPPGEYCETPGLLLPTDACYPGYYCIGGASVPTQMETPAGFFSLVGATVPLPCPPGQYNLYSAQKQCVSCPAGFYCGLPGTISPTVCPTGNYCPEETSLPAKCSAGTFSDVQGLVKLDQCEPCPSGRYCDSYGLSEPSGLCLAGFVCSGGSPIANPVAQTYGYVCPPASYCPEGSGSAIQCPVGSFRASTGGTSLASCALCPGGKHCSATALTSPSGLCSAGYYCVSNASSPTPTDGVTGSICPAGSYCPAASSTPIKCAAGTYAATKGQITCDTCPMGYFCDGVMTDTYAVCPTGHYCPPGTAEVPVPCPVGTFSDVIQLANVSECQDCTPGFFCDSLGQVTPTGPCAPGSFCPPRSENAFGKNEENDTHVCPAGAYCPEGTYLPLPCPVGTYSNDTGLPRPSDCMLCDEGAYCADVGLVKPTGLCDAGYFCKRNNTQARPSSGIVRIEANTVNGFELTIFVGGQSCPSGSYCPQGSVSPILCPEGSYTNNSGSPACFPCPPGYFCPLGCNDYLANLCPIGQYCPESTQRATQFPCPPGSFGNKTGLQGLSQCTPAPGGTFIDGYAAVKPSGYCRSGFYCSGGSPTGTPVEITATGGPCLPGTNCPEGSAIPIVCDAGAYCSSTNTDAALPCNEGFYCVQGSYTATPTGQNNSLGIIGDVCTRGHYCPKGTSNPTPCPPGTYSESTQNVNASYCLPCPAGFICNTSGIVTPREKCPAGFICTGGESSATRLCPKGSECPEGSSQPTLCAAGTFADEKGLALCKLCPERYYCQLGCIEPVQCPAGYYCPLQTPFSTKYPCLAGSYGHQPALASSQECAQCPPGMFCSGLQPTSSTSGKCAPGHYCAGSARTSKPTDGITGGLCQSGHVCLGGAWVSDPTDGITGQICAPGYYCPSGSSSQIRCPKGTYNSDGKQSSCLTCPAGDYCDTNATTPVPCPLNYFCPEGIQDPVLCPNGTYGHKVGLMSTDQCAPCTAGKYCVSGMVTGPCAAGYFCKTRNDNPSPLTGSTNGTNITSCTTKLWKTEPGGPCPIGHYCPEGVLYPTPCPKLFSRLETFGASLDDCGACPAGMSCRDGANTVICPAGSYCPEGTSDLPCPPGTFNPNTGMANLEDCVPCDAGKLCNRTGILNLADYDCPVGQYCLSGSSEAQACPAGSFRAVKGAKSAADCALCIGGSYCEANTTQPVVCGATTYCPVGSGAPKLCSGGNYCPYNTSVPVPCPEGYYCPPASGLPLICTVGHYCPSETVAQIPCPLGYVGRDTPLDGAYTSLYSACAACPPGTFGIDANRSRCDECIEGYVCLGATNSSHPTSPDVDSGYPCPPGYYCPPGSSSEIACPRGAYQPNYKASNVSACLLCPENSYQNAIGQASCLPCSTSAYAARGATQCMCTGSHRAFQMTDGYCICEPGYEFYDQDMILRSDEDGSVDCQPIVYDRCGSNQVRSDDGSCVSASSEACDASCNNGTGTYVTSLGVCQCDEQADLDTICNKKCRDEATQIQVNSSTGELQLYDPVTGEVSSLTDSNNLSGLVSKVSCPYGEDCQLRSLSVASTGFSGSYDLPPVLSDSVSRKRRLATSTSLSIANPMVCLSVGDGLLFDLSVPRSYPIYLKDSMLNTNPSFDYGAFRALAAKINANSSTVSAFAFSFTEAGTYVFGNSLNAAAQTIVVVMKAGTTCPTEAPIVPLNEKNLITVSAKRRTDDLILAPDWALIIGLLSGLLGVVVAVIAGLYYFRTKSWTNTAVTNTSGYRAKNKQVNLAAMHSKGTVAVTNEADNDGGAFAGALSTEQTTTKMKQLQLGGEGSNKGDKLEYKADLGRWDEEDLDLRELVDRLQYHHETVTKSFEDQKGDVKQLMQHLQAEAIELKRLFVNALVSSCLSTTSEAKREKSSSAPQDVDIKAAELLPMSTTSGRPSTRSLANRENFLLQNLERDLQERDQFEQKKSAVLDNVRAGLREVEEWSTQLTDLASALVEEMSLPVNDCTPERTTTSDESTCLERTRMVLDDLKIMLSSDPMSQTSSSLIHLTEAEKGRREVGNFVLESSLRCFGPHSTATDTKVEDLAETGNTIERLLDLHNNVEKAQNKEDDALLGPLPSLQKFGAALPQVLATLDDLEINFRHELDAVREQQNPVKLRAVQAQMQSRLNKLLKEVAAGAKKVNEKLEKETSRAQKFHRGALQAESALTLALAAAKEQARQVDQDQCDRIAATNFNIMQDASLTTPRPLSTPVVTDDIEKSSDDTLFQIKKLLVELATMMRTCIVPSIPQQQSTNASIELVDTRTLHAPAITRNTHITTKHNADEYALALDASYPQLSAAEKERLRDDFASDLRKIQSSVNVDATRTQADIATRQTATEVLRDAHKAQIQHREQEEVGALRAQHVEEEQFLESQFREEELAIEQEYLKELSTLKMEFEDTSADDDGDFAEPHEDMFEHFANAIAGDSSTPLYMKVHEQQVSPKNLPQQATTSDDDADIIAQLNNVYSQAWNDRVHLLDMEERLRKEQLSERLRRKRYAQQDNSTGNTKETDMALLMEKDTQQLIQISADYREAALEEIVKKQDDMDALQQETVERAVARLKEQLVERLSGNTYAESTDRHELADAIDEMASAARNSALKDIANGEEIIAKADNELQQLHKEYKRGFSALRDEINNERLRLETKLRENLLAKRQRRATGNKRESPMNEDEELYNKIRGDEESSPEEKLEGELETFTSQAIQELKGKYLHSQQKIEEQKALATLSVAAANAEIEFLDGLKSDGNSSYMSPKSALMEAIDERIDITGELLESLANQIPVQIEQQHQHALDRLHANYTAACNKRREELKADADAQRARLAEKMSRRRLKKQKETPTQETKLQPRVDDSAIKTIDEQERVALIAIDEELKIALEELGAREKQAVKVIGQDLSCSFFKSGKEVESFLRQCKQKHELALNKLEPGDKLKDVGHTVLNALSALEIEMSEREQVAVQHLEAVEHEISRLNKESLSAVTALAQSLEAEKRRQEQRLRQRMAQRREQQRSQLPPNSLPEQVADMDDIILKQESVEKQRLEDQLDTQAHLAFAEERAKRRENEDRLSQQLRDASILEATVVATKEAITQVRGEYANGVLSDDEALAPQLRLWETLMPRNASLSARKQSLVSRLAAQAVIAIVSSTSSIAGSENVVGETMTAELEQQIKDLSASHLCAWQQRRKELQADEAHRKSELERRLLYKREVKRRGGDNAEAAEQTHEKNYECDVELHQQLEATAIERKFAMEAELDSELEQLATAIQSAGTQTAADIEALLAACHSNFVTETSALRNALQVQRQAQQEALRQRLARKRQEKQGSSGNEMDPTVLAELEYDLKQEEASELSTFADDETRQLSALHDRLRNNVRVAFAEADLMAKTRCDNANSRLADSERELNSIYRDHEESKRALLEALEVERCRQQNKLLERAARRRAERLAELKCEYPNGVSEEVEQRALGLLENDYEHERLQLDDVLHEQDNLAQREHDDKVRVKEKALQIEIQRLRGEAEAAQAAREALLAAHCAEADRVTREFYNCLEGNVDIDALKARDHRRRLEERLAAKRTKKESSVLAPKTGESYATGAKSETPSKEKIPTDLEAAVVDELERELQKLHELHDRDWESLKTRTEEETRLRKTRLQERLQRKRQALNTSTTMSPAERAHAETVLDREEERENQRIDLSAASAARALELSAQRARDQAAEKLTEGFVESSDDVEALLMSIRQRHEEAQCNLRKTHDIERQKQEQLLEERLRQRRAARGEKIISEADKDEESKLHEQLNETLRDQETKAWAALSECQQEELDAALAPLQIEVERRHNAAVIGEREAREQLEWLTSERDRNLAELRKSLEIEKQRQQLILRDKLRRKRDQRNGNDTTVSAEQEYEEELRAFEALEISFDASVASVEAEIFDAHREKETELLAQLCAYSACSAVQEAALTVLDAACLQAERVRAEYDAALAARLGREVTERAVGRDGIARRLAEQKQKRLFQQQQKRLRNEAANIGEYDAIRDPINNQSKEVGDDSIDREIAIVQAAHARGVGARREQLEADIAARKAALAARLEHKRKTAVISSGNSNTDEVEKALQLEEQEELGAIERSRTVKLAEIEAEAAQEQEHLNLALREAHKRGAADIEQQLAACKLVHQAESAKLDETLRAERARQELALKQRLTARRYRQKPADTKDDEILNIDESDDAIRKKIDRQENEAREQLVSRQQHELAGVIRKLESETKAQRKAATDLQVAAERELRRLEEEHTKERRALQDSLLTDQRQREAQLREKLAKKKAARQIKGTQTQQDADFGLEEEIAMAALQEELRLEQAAAVAVERQRQEAVIRLAEEKLQEAAKLAAEAAAAARQAQDESVRVTAEFDLHRGEAVQLQAAQSAHSKRKLADRLAEKKQKQKLKQQQTEVLGESIAEKITSTSEQKDAERLRLEAQIEAQLAACREAHDAESAKLRESLRVERERQECALQERIARRKEKRAKAEVKGAARGDITATDEAEQKQEEEEEVALAAALATQEQQAWEAIQRKQDEDLRALREMKQQQERERIEQQKQLAEKEMNRLQQEHERELRTLEASLSLEQARQEEKLQQRIAQRRAKKQRQEEEAAANSVKLEQAVVDAEEDLKDKAAREKAKALAEAQAKADADAEEIERQEIAIRLAHKLEEERARQRRETQELTARITREAEEQAAKHAEVLALQLQHEAAVTADKLAREFDTNLRELRESHSADGAAQKARLESRIAAKKARKLRELEEKRELERQRLHARQQQEAEEAANAKMERVNALEEAVSQAALPVIEQEAVSVQSVISSELSLAEEKADDLIRAAGQQQHDVTAVQQLFTYGLVPQKLSLLGAVELVVSGRHERELMELLTGLAIRSSERVRRTLEIITQQKAARKADCLQELVAQRGSISETNHSLELKEEIDRVLAQLDRDFSSKLKEAEQTATVENEEAQAQAEKLIKERHMREVAYLLAHFDAQYTAALANVAPQQLQQPQQLQSVLSTPQREEDDLEAELRARLELETDERRRALDEEKHQELERLSREEEIQLAKVNDHLAASLAEEQVAMTKLLTSRLKALPEGKIKQRDAMKREHAAQLQRLELMLEGRGAQHKARVRARMTQHRLLIEDEFRRKAQVIIAVMNQRLAQEKMELRKKQNLLAPVAATPAGNDPSDHRRETGSTQSMLAVDLAKRLEDVLEERLTKIEALVAAYNRPEQTSSTQDIADANNTDRKDMASAVAYRLAVVEAVAVGCRYEKPLVMNGETSLSSSIFGVLGIEELDALALEQVSVDQLDERMRVRCQFAEVLLHAVTSKQEAAPAVVIVSSFGRGKKSDYASFSPTKVGINGENGCGTLYLSLAALQELSTGQLAVVILHALTQVRAHTSDLTEPEFISHLYALLIQCYQGLFTRVQERIHLPADYAQNHTDKIQADKTSSISGGGVKPTETCQNEEDGQWQTRLHEMEKFLTRLSDRQEGTSPLHAMQRLQGSRTRLLANPREADNVGGIPDTMTTLTAADPWPPEQQQLLQEKLDTAEKLYLQVLRQHEQQTQTVEYWQDLLAEQRDAEYDEDAFDEEEEEEEKEVGGGKPGKENLSVIERQRERDARAQEAQTELDRATNALEATRMERDELFGQCQQLRDQLTLLRKGHRQ